MTAARRLRRPVPSPSILALVAVLLLAEGPAARLAAQVRPVYSLGAAGVLQQIEKLRTTASALVVAAHPDDEDSAFIAREARGDHARVAYLSLNRGEGGQNVIGPELFEALGVIRTEELLQARALDGGEQFFARTFDFGFSKTMEEASRLWGEREVMADIVRTIRMYRPLVVYSIFGGTPADGHGHHQLSGKLTPEAFRAAADPTQFPEQIAEGLRPWRALKLYRGAGFGPFGPGPGITPTARIETGQRDPLLGRSYLEIAAEGRSQHKSQKMGMPELRGPRQSGLILVEAAVKTSADETSVFDGIDTSVSGLAELVGLPSGSLKVELTAIDRAVEKAIQGFDALDPGKSVPALAGALTAIRSARAAVKSTTGATKDGGTDADFLLAIKERDAVLALQMASGTVIDAASDVETAGAGESFDSTVRVFLAQPSLVKITEVTLQTPAGWRVESVQPSQPDPKDFMANYFRETADRTDAFRLTVASDAPPTQPYWLTAPRQGLLFSWPPGAPKGEPFDPPLVVALVQAEIGGAPVTLRQPLQYRLIDPVRGELRRNVEVVPAVTVSLDSQLEVVPLGERGRPRRIAVRLQSNAESPQTGVARLDVPAGWSVTPIESPFSLKRRGERTALVFTVTPGGSASAGQYTLKAVATVSGRVFDLAMRTISYPHIQTHRLYSTALAQVRVLDLKVSPVTVGYIMGTGDLVPEALRRMGLNAAFLDEDALAAGELSGFDTIVVGIRASEARPDFVAATGRLLDYVRGGGTLIVQYQQNDYVARNLPPFPAHMASRVTDETAEVKILAPTHRIFTTPNRIGPEDFTGWVQERNLYAFTTFDPQYTALLESHDPGEPPQQGGEVYARLGKGQYVYTAYAWFRQLPAGVPGAYRMFANLVSLGAKN
jgi:LmbE family N-acetylglucosaminyl deacetylase